jgi:BASS family bile acid:Na+ symporter
MIFFSIFVKKFNKSNYKKMIQRIVQEIFFSRNLLLILSVFAGFFFGEFAVYTKELIFSLLIIIMIFSSSGIPTSAIFPLKSVVKPILKGIFLNYILLGAVVIPLAYFLIPNELMFYGFVVIAATPP